ncbi:MAG: molybdopterin cofactor-binding domain-containing protein [Burkholderiaceae bacterium]
MTTTSTLDRRQFLGAASGLTIGLCLPFGAARAATTAAVNAWLTIGTDNVIQLAIGASEMGQGSFAGLAQILCEDLMVDPARVRYPRQSRGLGFVSPSKGQEAGVA